MRAHRLPCDNIATNTLPSQHAAIAAERRLVVEWIDASALEPGTRETDAEAFTSSWDTVRAAHGILVPGGFGDRGVEGKILAVQHARETKKPFLGICLGMQCAVIEYARNVLGKAGANSAEFDAKSPYPAVVFMPEINPAFMGGTMRLGARATVLRGRPDAKPCLAKDLYGRDLKREWCCRGDGCGVCCMPLLLRLICGFFCAALCARRVRASAVFVLQVCVRPTRSHADD
jgi:CTP synthase (UTP-ammonia lyase)